MEAQESLDFSGVRCSTRSLSAQPRCIGWWILIHWAVDKRRCVTAQELMLCNVKNIHGSHASVDGRVSDVFLALFGGQNGNYKCHRHSDILACSMHAKKRWYAYRLSFDYFF